VYDAADERIGVIDYKTADGVHESWSFRDLGKHVIRDVAHKAGGPWTWSADYLFRGDKVSEMVDSQGRVYDAHLDHLGTIRGLTDAQGHVVDGERKYLPFGEPLSKTPLVARLAFTGHEHDDFSASSPTADLEYMHARYYSAWGGRFLSIDPTWDSADLDKPQSWNRYAYVRNNPVGAVDPDGRADIKTNCEVGKACEAYTTKMLNDAAGRENVSSQVRMTDSTGQIRVMDNTVKMPSGKQRLVEVKAGGATKTTAQAEFDTRAETSGKVVSGTKRAASFGPKGATVEVEGTTQVQYSEEAAANIAKNGARAFVGLQIIHTLFEIPGLMRFEKNYEKEFGEKPSMAASWYYLLTGDEHPKCTNCA
jgi:RHS repeat-associated protein